ncbi:MAG: helix-turn-helix transcriptional regulator [Defluviitaleaceae bacterium]|nr:helix-turn-helix transcriptional regulator [Defluviitaleaceae bacterium]
MGITSKIESANNPSIGEKIRLLRKAKGITQAELSENIWSSAAQISRVEIGEEAYKPEELEAIKKYFKIENMPLTDFERATFRERLHVWRDLIRDQRLVRARKLHKEMLPLINLEPCDPDLAIYFRLFEVLLLLTERDFDTAKEKLDYLHRVKDKMNTELTYHYYHRMGSLYSMRYSDNKSALKFYLQAYELTKSFKGISTEDNETLYINISTCYINVGLSHRAIIFLGEIRKENNGKRLTITDIGINITLARAYIMVGEFIEAKEVLNRCLVQAKGIGNDHCTILSLFYLGLLCKRSKNLEKAIEYFDETLSIVKTTSNYHPWSFYYKICCLLKPRETFKAEKVLEEAKVFYGTETKYSIIFESLEHAIEINKRVTIFNKESVEYIENVTIPHFMKIHLNFEAISYYELLELHYEKSRKSSKASLMTKAMRDIYKEMFFNKGGESL